MKPASMYTTLVPAASATGALHTISELQDVQGLSAGASLPARRLTDLPEAALVCLKILAISSYKSEVTCVSIEGEIEVRFGRAIPASLAASYLTMESDKYVPAEIQPAGEPDVQLDPVSIIARGGTLAMCD